VSDTPIDLLASRVWSGSKWHYPHIEAMLSDIKRLRDELAAMQKQRDEAVELYTDLLRRLSGSTPPRAAFLSGDATQKEGGGA
jgi:hypothetical protein